MILIRRLSADAEADEEEAAALHAQHEAYLAAGRRCPDVDGEPCWYCEESDYSGDEDWEVFRGEPEEERGPHAHPATYCGFRKFFLSPRKSSSQDGLQLRIVVPQKQQLTAEEAEKNAEELVAEEERIKQRAEKKRMKKRRQKDRKRQAKREQELKTESRADRPSGSADVPDPQPGVTVASVLGPSPADSEGSSSEASPSRSPQRSTEEETEEELDLSSTFVSKARLKVGAKALPPKKEKAAKPDGKEAPASATQEVLQAAPQRTPVEQSMVLADCGNETAKQGHYREAVLLFTEAIKLNPREYRFFGNRSFCYERLQCCAEALRDAQLALSLRPGWPKGLFRLGKALMGLKHYAEAARTFEELLRLDEFRADAAVQLRRCQVQRVLENGYSCCALGWGGLAGDARVPLPGGQSAARGDGPAGGPLALATLAGSRSTRPIPAAAPGPGRELFAMWVGNLTPKITEGVLLWYFQPFGPIDSIRRLPRRFCAFVNYLHQEAAEAAYVALQGVEVEGSRLLLQLKHPVHATPPHTKGPPAPSRLRSERVQRAPLPVQRDLPPPEDVVLRGPGPRPVCAPRGGRIRIMCLPPRCRDPALPPPHPEPVLRGRLGPCFARPGRRPGRGRIGKISLVTPSANLRQPRQPV